MARSGDWRLRIVELRAVPEGFSRRGDWSPRVSSNCTKLIVSFVLFQNDLASSQKRIEELELAVASIRKTNDKLISEAASTASKLIFVFLS